MALIQRDFRKDKPKPLRVPPLLSSTRRRGGGVKILTIPCLCRDKL